MTEDLIEFVRRARTGWLLPGAPPDAFRLLGVDDETLDRWRDSAGRVVTLPHASPNVFHPRTRVGWYAGHVLKRHPDRHHVRVVLTHVNFSDLGWRPYAWWSLSPDGEVRVYRQFSRNKKQKHVVVSSRPGMTETPDGLGAVDAEAARAALWGADLSVSYMLISAVVERAAGMVAAGRASYVPLTALVGFARSQAAAGDVAWGDWCRGLTAQAGGRRVGADGRLEPCDPAVADVFDNYSNLAALALLGGPQVLGGGKMAAYWPAVEAVLDPLARPKTETPTLDLRVVPDVDLMGPIRPSPAVQTQLEALGVPYSQGLAVAEHGAFATAYDPFDSGPVHTSSPPGARDGRVRVTDDRQRAGEPR